jgi:hypothetical protein
MMVVDMHPMPPKVIRRETCLQAKISSRLLKDLGPKRHPNTWRRDESKEVKDFMKVEEGRVNRKRYDGRCMK